MQERRGGVEKARERERDCLTSERERWWVRKKKGDTLGSNARERWGRERLVAGVTVRWRKRGRLHMESTPRKLRRTVERETV